MLAEDYEKEQRESELKIVSLSAEISEAEAQSDNPERFISKIHKCLDLQELTPAILNDMVKRVYVYAPHKNEHRFFGGAHFVCCSAKELVPCQTTKCPSPVG